MDTERDTRPFSRSPALIAGRGPLYFSHRTLAGVELSHAVVSVTPLAISAQAFWVALRRANSWVDPAAVRQLRRP